MVPIMFTDVFGKSPQTKILDFLADHPEYDYSISEIAQHSKVSRPTVYKIIDVLLEKKLLVRTREQGNSPLYKLNSENTLIQIILRFDFELASKAADQEQQKPMRKDAARVVKHVQRKTQQRTAVPS
jgi:DNA-binding transcriptional ArsR family regulator